MLHQTVVTDLLVLWYPWNCNDLSTWIYIITASTQPSGFWSSSLFQYPATFIMICNGEGAGRMTVVLLLQHQCWRLLYLRTVQCHHRDGQLIVGLVVSCTLMICWQNFWLPQESGSSPCSGGRISTCTPSDRHIQNSLLEACHCTSVHRSQLSSPLQWYLPTPSNLLMGNEITGFVVSRTVMVWTHWPYNFSEPSVKLPNVLVKI